MTRIIGGLAGSLKLASPAKSTRPTSDRIRESIFSRLESRGAIEEARALDLYAGTGALALEALSRGAKSAFLVEKDGKAAAVCIQNSNTIQRALEKQGVEVFVKTVNKSVGSFLAGDVSEYDLVFIDPPYEVENELVEAELEALLPRLSKGAVVIVERSSRSVELNYPAGYQFEETKSYGDTNVTWLEKN
jgi:16S rRNA (guanine966-N2)-methyltransferase